MKKKIIVAIAFTAMVNTSFAQGFYLNLGLGYGFAAASQTVYNTPIPYNGFPSAYSGYSNNIGNTQLYSKLGGASFTAGSNTTFGIGYMFNEHVGFQIDGVLGLSSKKYTFLDSNVLLTSPNGPLNCFTITTQQANTSFMVIPSIVMQTGDILNIYSRVGLVLPLNSSITQDMYLGNAPGTGVLMLDDYTWQLKTSFSIGFNAAAGVKYKLNERTTFWGEFSFFSLSLYTKEQDLKSITETSQGLTTSYAVSSFQYSPVIHYGKSATVDSTFSSMPAYSVPFSSIGIKIGLAFNLSNDINHRQSGRKDDDIDPNKPFRRR